MPEKVIVAVHGIGDQFTYATIQAVAYRLCAYYDVPAAIPLGRFHEMLQAGHGAFVLKSPPDPQLPHAITLAEVYWAGFPRRVVKDGYALEESKRWARTIVARVRLNCAHYAGLRAEDYVLMESVLDEMIEAIRVLERLAFIGDRAGLFTFDLRKLLDDFLGDVQIVTEFKNYREEILGQFNSVMEAVSKHSPADAQIHLVAHSEGTVITLIGLLSAMAAKAPPVWLQQVRGLMTIGSPIDMHMILWPELWAQIGAPRWQPGEPIKWRNYYDYGDPIADRLDFAREWLSRAHGKTFEFQDTHDYGFSRYYFPGKAHVDYWEDEQVFGHFIEEVIDAPPSSTASAPSKAAPSRARRFSSPPKTKARAEIFSYVAPYAIVGALLFTAMYFLYRSVNGAVAPQAPDPALSVLRNAGGLALLLYGMTVMTRIPRLTPMRRWHALGVVLFLVGAFAYVVIVEEAARQAIGAPFGLIGVDPTWGVLGIVSVVVVVCWALSRRHAVPGVRVLIATGGAATLALVAYLLAAADERGAVWPVVLSSAAFLYLWSLAALLFDLIFIWHRYIRHSVGIINLRESTKSATAGTERG